MAALAEADLPRRNDLDGRGALSREGLHRFCTFFLECCLDQVRFMRGVLQLNHLASRLSAYVELRHRDVVMGPTGRLSRHAMPVLRECLFAGRIKRGEVARLTRLSSRAATMLIAQLLQEGLLVADSVRGPVRLGFPLHALRYLLPELFPEGNSDA